MPSSPHPDAIDTRLVFRIYAWITITSGVLIYMWPLRFFPEVRALPNLDGVPYGRFALLRTAAALVIALGMCAAGFRRIDDPVSRRRALYWFAFAHLTVGAMFFIQWHAIISVALPSAVVGWTPIVVGLVLLYIAATCAHAPRLDRRRFTGLFDDEPLRGVRVVQERSGLGMDALRSQYEHQIRQAARQEERARLARDLHDAVKQQLFAVQMSAATVQERISGDDEPARAAIAQVRASARDAMTEMDALIGQLQSMPIENTGLVTAIKEHCEALELRTGAQVHFEAGTLPPSDRLPPGAQQALFRAAQETLSNVARHARATHVKVRLGMSGEYFELSIRDDGAGFDQQGARGMGLANIDTRIGEVGGAVLVQSMPGRGTTVAFSVPADTRTARDFATKAWLWAGALALMILSAAIGDDWERPWNAALAAVFAVSAARSVVAWYRVRKRAARAPAEMTV